MPAGNKGLAQNGPHRAWFCLRAGGASQHYVDLALQTLPLEYLELNAGNALFFHSNLWYCPAANLSYNARWSLTSRYNRAANVPYNEPNNTGTVPLTIVPDKALLTWQNEDLNETANFLPKEKMKRYNDIIKKKP